MSALGPIEFSVTFCDPTVSFEECRWVGVGTYVVKTSEVHVWRIYTIQKSILIRYSINLRCYSSKDIDKFKAEISNTYNYSLSAERFHTCRLHGCDDVSPESLCKVDGMSILQLRQVLEKFIPTAFWNWIIAPKEGKLYDL